MPTTYDMWKKAGTYFVENNYFRDRGEHNFPDFLSLLTYVIDNSPEDRVNFVANKGKIKVNVGDVNHITVEEQGLADLVLKGHNGLVTANNKLGRIHKNSKPVKGRKD